MDVSVPDEKEFIHNLSKKSALAYSQVRKDFPNWKDNDVRITTYSKCANITENILFSWYFKDEQLSDSNWYSRIPYIQTPTATQIKTTQVGYQSFLMISFVHWYLTSFEHFFRILIKQIIPSSNASKLYKICAEVLTHFGLEACYQDKFDIYRFLRNSMHNNGIVADRHARPITYDGVLYNFEFGKQIKNANWFMLCRVATELHDCLEKICKNNEVSQMPFIEDPAFFEVSDFSYVSFEL